MGKQELLLFQLRIYAYSILLCILLGIIGFFVIDPFLPLVKGLFFGSVLGFLTFRLLALTIEKAVRMNPAGAQTHTTIMYVLRFVITGFALLVAIQSEQLNAFGFIAGLLSVKISIFFLGTKRSFLS